MDGRSKEGRRRLTWTDIKDGTKVRCKTRNRYNKTCKNFVSTNPEAKGLCDYHWGGGSTYNNLIYPEYYYEECV